MNYYPIQSEAIILNPLHMDESRDQLSVLCKDTGFLYNSRVYTHELNLSDSTHRFFTCIASESYWFYNRLFIVQENQTQTPRGIIGLKDIDWIQRRGELILIIDPPGVKQKICYEPLKLLLVKIFKEWYFHRVWIKILSTDSLTATVLKGFGFTDEGLLRDEILMDGEYTDIKIMGLLKEEFHYNG